MSKGGAFFFRALTDAVAEETAGFHSDDVLAEVLWDLVFAGLVTGDTLAPLRARLTGGRTTHKAKAAAPRARQRGVSGLALLSAGRQQRVGPAVRRGGPPMVAGRWSLIPEVETDPTIRAHAAAEVLLDRYGIVTRGSVVAEETPGGFAAVYKVLSAFEESGQGAARLLRRGLGRRPVRDGRRGGPGAGFRQLRRRPGPRWGHWCWRPPTRPIRSVPPCPGRSGPVTRTPSTVRPGEPARWSCWWTAPRCCTPNAAAAR